MDPRKRSQIVGLTLVGGAVGVIGLANAFPPQQMRRNLYPDRAACERDYSPAQCEANSGSGSRGGSGSSSGYHGPYYHSDRGSSAAANDPGAGRTGQVTRTEISTRGGFGSFGRGLRAIG